MLQHWLDKFDTRINAQRLAKQGARCLVETVLRDNVALGTCFSEDSDLLSQWRGYAQDGAGFSVTFDRDKLNSLGSSFDGGPHLELSKISYGYQDHVEINEVVKKLGSAFGPDATLYQESQDQIGSMSLSYTPEKHELQKAAGRSLFTVKNGAFKEEKEWRLFVYDSISKFRDVDFRENRNVLSPFIRLNVSADAILGVTLGPTNRTTKLMVEGILSTYQIKGWVHKSTASYRNS